MNLIRQIWCSQRKPKRDFSSTRSSVAVAWTRGFTVIELMVTISIIGILVSLLMPAIQHAREAARRTTCKSHLRQLALGFHQYEESYNCLPMAVIPSPVGSHADFQGFKFNAQLLPFIEQLASFHDLSQRTQRPLLTAWYALHQSPLPEGAVTIPIFRCPSSILPAHAESMSPESSRKLRDEILGLATSDYVAMGGASAWFGMFPMSPGSWVYGVVRRSADVTDGLSNTIAIGERSYPGPKGQSFPIWVSTYGPRDGGNVLDTHQGINCVSAFGGQFWRTAYGESCALSLHPGICQFAFGDGSVRPLSENIDAFVYTCLGGIADGQVISGDF